EAIERTTSATPAAVSAQLTIVPIRFAEACRLIERHHRHHKPARGHKFSLAVTAGDQVVGVATVGRPVARRLGDGGTLEVNRSCTDGTPNANSMLYAAAWRVAKNLGYRRLITYTLPEESGSSLRAAGWRRVGAAGGGSWNKPLRPRVDAHPLGRKIR